MDELSSSQPIPQSPAQAESAYELIATAQLPLLLGDMTTLYMTMPHTIRITPQSRLLQARILTIRRFE